MIYDGPFIHAQEMYALNRAVLVYSQAARLARGALYGIASSRTVRTLAVAATFGAGLVSSGCATELATGERENYAIESTPLPPPCTITVTDPEGTALRFSPQILGAGNGEVDNIAGTALSGAQLDSYGNTAHEDSVDWFDVIENDPTLGPTTFWVSASDSNRVCSTPPPPQQE